MMSWRGLQSKVRIKLFSVVADPVIPEQEPLQNFHSLKCHLHPQVIGILSSIDTLFPFHAHSLHAFCRGYCTIIFTITARTCNHLCMHALIRCHLMYCVLSFLLANCICVFTYWHALLHSTPGDNRLCWQTSTCSRQHLNSLLLFLPAAWN